jgi:hypothetical protein
MDMKNKQYDIFKESLSEALHTLTGTAIAGVVVVAGGSLIFILLGLPTIAYEYGMTIYPKPLADYTQIHFCLQFIWIAFCILFFNNYNEKTEAA